MYNKISLHKNKGLKVNLKTKHNRPFCNLLGDKFIIVSHRVTVKTFFEHISEFLKQN